MVISPSTLLATTMPSMEITFKAVIGGAPAPQAFADQIGIDCFSSDAPGVVNLSGRLSCRSKY